MTWYAVYDKATGALMSTGSVIGDPLPDELAVVECDENPDHSTWVPDLTAFALTPAPEPEPEEENETPAPPALGEAEEDDDSED